MLQDLGTLVLLKMHENFQHIITRTLMEFNIILQNYAQREMTTDLGSGDRFPNTVHYKPIFSLLQDN